MSNKFIKRWSEQKLQASTDEQPPLQETAVEPVQSEEIALEHSDSQQPVQDEEQKSDSLASLLASQASEEVKKLALRKLFMSGEFHHVDPLNDYAHDFSSAKSLSAEVGKQLRQWLSQPSEDELIADSAVENENKASSSDVSVDKPPSLPSDNDNIENV
ncbi:Protein of unknown function [Vibrio xiamenensis]|uniref:DUF3306 domain-containing protein n=1 Tax=Vibrio xiamenensis TaxID=861298 RepID=A0A1G7YCA5_9VIBR|nr:DUF3306 domain-containing protein [Vibrio xiamenensis]SDG93946.1 Protein of unknown function [Vibrio xiamenensis]